MKKKDWQIARTCVYNTGYHFVWSTKYRRQILVGDVAITVEKLFYEIANIHNFVIQYCGLMPDHVHLFVSAHPRISASNIAKWLKGSSSRKLFLWYPHLRKVLWKRRLWNPSYYVGTAGKVTKETIKKYIEEQETK